jgi:hypothetical protein
VPSKIWVVGEEVLAADFNQYVQEQVIAVFANAAARTSAITAPKEGMHSYLLDVGQLHVFRSGAWRVSLEGAQGLLARKALTGSAGFNNNYYDISAGGVIATVGANRAIHVQVQVAFYLPVNGRNITVRAHRNTPSAVTLGTVGGRTATDIYTATCTFIDPAPPAGPVAYGVDAATDYSTDAGIVATHERHVWIIDAGPYTPAPTAKPGDEELPEPKEEEVTA